jgi:hypothetical protein
MEQDDAAGAQIAVEASGARTLRAPRASAPWSTRIAPGSWNRPSHYRADDKGFVLGTIYRPSQSIKGCVAWGYASQNGVRACVTGGNMGCFGELWSMEMTVNPNSFLFPIAPGDFYIGVEQNSGHGQQVDAPYYFYWISMTGAGITWYPSRSAADEAFEPPPMPVLEEMPARDPQAFVAILERLLHRPVDPAGKAQYLALRSREDTEGVP